MVKLYGICKYGDPQLEEIEAEEKPNSYVISRKDGISSYGYAVRVMKDDPRVALTPQEAWSKAIGVAEQQVIIAEADWQRAKDKVKKLRIAQQS